MQDATGSVVETPPAGPEDSRVQDASGPPAVPPGCAACGRETAGGARYCALHALDTWGDHDTARRLRPAAAPMPIHPTRGVPRCMNQACKAPMPEGEGRYCPRCVGTGQYRNPPPRETAPATAAGVAD